MAVATLLQSVPVHLLFCGIRNVNKGGGGPVEFYVEFLKAMLKVSLRGSFCLCVLS